MPSGYKNPEQHPDSENKLFLQAMQDVIPIPKSRYLEKTVKPYKPLTRPQNTDSEILTRLKKLVSCGKGFVVADTTEYMEGTGYNVNPEIMRALHRGDFSIQDHIDLHGFTVSKAKVYFNEFLKDSIRTGKRGILIVHGRGLFSPQQPGLKLKVYEWLTRGHWRKWIIAFTSARAVDGGAGATYVLFRRYPAPKRLKKKELIGS
jgi:DNA-nicking Smr family endonuclease